jgi:lysophospholipase L1-like esterase
MKMFLLLLLFTSGEAALGDPPVLNAPPTLPEPAGEVVDVSSVEELFRAVEEIPDGGTVRLADGHYFLPSVLTIAGDGVTLRSRSGDRTRVVLDGERSRHGELVLIRGQGVTVANLTIQNIKWNGFKIGSEFGAQRATISNCVIRNIWQRGVKASHIPPESPELYPRDCRIQFCLFVNDRPKRFEDDETDTPRTYNGNYIGGIDVKNTHGWTISDNVFVGIRGRTREGRACIYVSEEGVDCVIERNVIVDCDVGIALGNPSLVGDWLHATDCIVRNNFITRCPETGILACYTENCRILHNTIHEPISRFGRLIWVQNENDGLLVANNLLSGPEIRITSDSRMTLENNVVREDLSDLFADVEGGDLRLRGPLPGVTAAVPRHPLVSHDIENRPRIGPPDAGAHQITLAQSAQPDPAPPSQPVKQNDELPVWVEPMRKIHAGFEGQSGYVAQLGDSITHSMAFWTPIGWDEPQQYLSNDDGLPPKPAGTCWQDVIQGERDKGPDHGNYSGWRVENVLAAADGVLQRHRPELAIIMIGTNDISGGSVPDRYRRDLEQLVEKCLQAHCIPILNTIPPRRNHQQAVEDVNEIIRDVAGEKRIPLVDYHAEIVRLRPEGTWQGTLISDDGVHPTAGETNVYTEENLQNSGYALRNWLNFLAVREVHFRVLHPHD